METKFTSIAKKIQLTAALERGEKESIRYVMDEINRLEAVIRGYETGIIHINDRFKSKNFKNPGSFPKISG